MDLNSTFALNFAKAVLLSNKALRNIAFKQYEKALYKKIFEGKNPLYSKNVKLIKYYCGLALANTFIRNFDGKYISKKSAKMLIDTVLKASLSQGDNREEVIAEYINKHGIEPPFFLAISPTKKCNLCCTGCYASSKATDAETLDWSTLDKVMREAHDEMGIRFFVISGGEPLTYQSEGKTILDLPRKFRDSFFLMYTNGTLINEKLIEEIADLGNVTPSISIEGFEKDTDQRRGVGMYQKILTAMRNLGKAGVIFGASVTVTKDNINILLDESFYSVFFEELKASYMWLFQYMPIGRNFTTEMMINPEQRFELFKKWRQLLCEKQWFIADFWNSAITSNGCISCGKPDGYFYIDWNGNIMPCVFVPYYTDNVKDLFARGKKLEDALFSDFFVKGRAWQTGYFNQDGKQGNMLMPCFIRDHHKEFLKIARDECHVLPEDAAADEAMNDTAYHNTLVEFGEKLKTIEEPCWNSEYLEK